MKIFTFIIFTLKFSVGTFSQDFKFDPPKRQIDSKSEWTYNFTKGTSVNSYSLTFKRKNVVTHSETKETMLPEITFQIFSIDKLDSLTKRTQELIPLLSCCYPICGPTLIQTENFVFWSSPWNNKNAFECNGIDYTRGNAENILKSVAYKKYNSIESLINDLRIEKY